MPHTRLRTFWNSRRKHINRNGEEGVIDYAIKESGIYADSGVCEHLNQAQNAKGEEIMSAKKRIISVILSFVMVTGMCATTFAAESIPDVAGVTQEEYMILTRNNCT